VRWVLAVVYEAEEAKEGLMLVQKELLE